MNDENNDINREIISLTNKLRESKPTVYKNLVETPNTIPTGQENVDHEDLVKYKNTLIKLLND
jgi:hypothetical protein